MPNGDPISLLRQPAQQVTRAETGESEVKRVWQQFKAALIVSELAWVALLAIAALLGKSVMTGLTAAAMLMVGLAYLGQCSDWTERGIALVITSSALFVWLMFAPDVVGWVWSWRIAWRLWAIGGGIIFIACAAALAWRMFVEIFNPNWPPPLNPRDAGNGGIGAPWAKYRDPNAPLVRDVPDRDPVLVYAQNGEPRQVQREEIRELMTSAGIGQAEAAVTPRERELHDLRTFIVKGSRPGVGFSRRAWEGRPLPYLGPVTQAWWADTTDKLVHAGVLERVGNRTQLACAVDVALEAVR